GTVVVWETATGEHADIFEHSSGVRLAFFDPTGHHIVTACDDGRVQLWDAQARVKTRLERRADEGGVSAIVLSPPPLLGTFKLPGGIIHAGYTDDFLTAISNVDLEPGKPRIGVWVAKWQVGPDERSVDDIQGEAEVVACRSLSKSGRPRILGPDKLRGWK